MSINKIQPKFSLNFTAEMFPEHLNGEEKCVLALYVEYLLSEVTFGLSRIFSHEIASINKNILPYITNRELYIEVDDKSEILNSIAFNIIEQIQKSLKGVLIKYHACAFISSTLQYRKYNIEKFNQYKLLVLLCVTRLAQMGKHNSAIHSILSEIRQLSLGKREMLLPHLPNPSINEIKILIGKLDERRNDENVSKSIKSFLSHYFVSFNDAYELNRGREFNRISGERTITTMVMSPKEREDDDDEGYVVHRLKTEVKENKKVKDFWETEEENNIPEKIQVFAVINKSESEPVEQIRRATKAKNIVERLSMRNQSLSCDYKILTSYEVSKLLTYVLNDLTDHGHHFNHAHTLLFCLLFGRTPCEIEEIQNLRKTRFSYDKEKMIWKIKIKHRVSTYKQEAAIAHLISNVDEYVEYFLPEFASSLLKQRITIASTEEVQGYLTSINKKNNTRLSIPRIASYFVDFCKDKNVDPVLIEVISQTDSRQDSGTPYSHITQKQINTTMNLFIHYLNTLLTPEHKDLLIPNIALNVDDGKSIGSPLMLKDDEIIKVNKQHIHHIKELRTFSREKIRLHNEYVFYVYKMLILASGYRPVTGTGGKFDDINFISNEYWISDKENRDRDSARIVVLPEMVIQQLNEYKKHLSELKYQIKFKATAIAKRIDEVFGNNKHFLFLISDDEVIAEVTPKTIKPFMDTQFPVQLNWNRHYIRSKLMMLNISPSIIYHFMGHDDIGLEGMGRYSGLSYADFKGLATKINTVLEELKFEVVEGL